MNQTDPLGPILMKLKEVSSDTNDERESLEIIGQIFLLRLKKLILLNIRKEHMAQFDKVIRLNNSTALLKFASEEIPSFSEKVTTMIEDLTKELQYKK